MKKKNNKMKWFKSNVLDIIILVLILVLVVKVFSMPTVSETQEQLLTEETSFEASTTPDTITEAEAEQLVSEPLAEPAE